ncbi:hypothetical protein HPG69_001460 [Diceros bicornis minor]|uniref:Uncharacterized protein n=1 Tax=Diceros bicornis minor TaxID=77932 RepID=A0A7J7FFP7_DICBM|nr:hypothetical protein HPG69_001460 [Diceros bicornis minor]
MSMKWISVLPLLQLSCYFRLGSGGKVLMWPIEYSHWINMKTILDELVQRGHEMFFRKVIDQWTYDLPKETFWTYFSLMQECFWEYSDCIEKLCKEMVLNKKLKTTRIKV